MKNSAAWHRTWPRLAAALTAALVVIVGSAGTAAAQALPQVSLSAPDTTPLIGAPVTFTLQFDNASPSQTGFGPYVDLVLPANGADGSGVSATGNDGMTFVSATYLGVPVVSTSLTFDAAGHAVHPYAVDTAGAPLVVSGTPGDQLVVLRLPFGSFTADQPAASVVVTASLSDLADAGAPLAVSARGGFQYGNDALANPPTDPSLVQPTPVTASFTPQVLRLTKTYIGPENETATGPNFPRSYRITVDVAANQTVTDLDVTDALPPNLQFLAVVAASAAGSPTVTPVATPSTTVPGGTLTRRFSSVTGTSAADDATVEFTCFVPRLDASSAAVIDPASADAVQVPNNAGTSGQWDPIDARDAVTTVTAAGASAPAEHTLTARGLAVQKHYAVVNDTGAAGPTPGDTVEYVIDVQVSDFFAFENLVVTDLASDGQRPDAGFAPTLSVVEHTGQDVATAAFAPANAVFLVDSPGAGTTLATFAVSTELVRRALSQPGLDGRVVGGCIPQGGTGGVAPACPVAGFNGGPTTLRIVYRTVIQEEFTDTFPSGDPSVDEGDVLDNAANASGAVLDIDDVSAPTGFTEADGSSVTLKILTGVLAKSIYAINGNTVLPSPVRFGPGDAVTYRLVHTLPTSDVEPFSIVDYLPLPVLHATQVAAFGGGGPSASAPPPGVFTFGPTETFNSLSGLTPTLAVDAASNGVTFSYPAFDSPTNLSTRVDLLFTVTASADPFADGLFLTNQARTTVPSTNAGTGVFDAIVQIQLNEPSLLVTKGVVATSNAAGVFAPVARGPVTFNAPGTPGVRWSGTIHSTGLAATPVNSNLSAVDAADLVTFAIVVENIGNGPEGAFDVRVRDDLPTGFVVPAGGLNLQVRNGAGVALPYSAIGTGLFDPAGGIELTDPAADQGALTVTHATSGANIAVITYDLEVAGTVRPSQQIDNTATLTNYAGVNGGPDFTAVDPTDTARVSVTAPSVTKSVITTNQAHTTGLNVAIGELVQYQVVVRVPEATLPSATFTDVLPAGLAFVSLDTITASPGLTASVGTFDAVRTAAVISAVGAGVANAGRQAQYSFGTLTNSDTDNATPETITFTYTVAVINGGSNDRGDTRRNTGTLAYTGGSVLGQAPNVTIVEPALQVAKSVAPASGDAGDTVVFTVVVSHAAGSNADAFNLSFADALPVGLVLTGATNTGGVVPTTGPTVSGNSFAATFDRLDVGQSSTFSVSATISTALPSGTALTNTAVVTWTSLPTSVLTPQSSYNTLSTERTGNPADPGGNDNDHVAQGSAALTVSTAGVTKTLVATNQASTTGTDVAIGEIVTYQVQVTLPEALSPGVTLVDTLDPGLAFVGVDSITVSDPADVTTTAPGGFAGVPASAIVSNPGGTAETAGSRVTFNFGDINNADTNANVAETITVVYRAVVINAAANLRGQARNNTATWTAGSVSVPASAPNVTIVEPILVIDKQISPAWADAGDSVTVTLTVAHGAASNATAFDVAMTDVLPAGLVFAGTLQHAGGLAPATLAQASGTISASWSAFPVGATSTITFAATVATSAAPGAVVTNTAQITYSGLPGIVATTLSPHNALGVERTGNPADIGGAVNTYRGSDPANVTLHTNSLSGYVYRDRNDDGVFSQGSETPIPGVTIVLTGTDHLGQPVSLTTTTGADGLYQFAGLRPGTYVIDERQPTGYADGRDALGTPFGGTPANDRFTNVVIPTGASTAGVNYNFGERETADVSVAKTASRNPVPPGGSLSYTLLVANAGPAAATEVVVVDPLPIGMVFAAITQSGWTCATPAVGDTGTVSCSRATFASGASDAIVIDVLCARQAVAFNPSPATPGAVTGASCQIDGAVLTNVATVRATTVDPDPTNNRDHVDTVVGQPGTADLAITKVDVADPVVVGDTITYTLVVTNRGPSDATGVTVVDSLPPSVVFVSATPSQGPGCTGAATVQCALGSIASGATASITVIVTSTVRGKVNNHATVTGNEPDVVPGNNLVDEPTTVVGPTDADLAVVKTAIPLVATPDAVIAYRLAITNRGAATAANVTVTDSLPPGTSVDGVDVPAGWTCPAPIAGVLTCTAATLAPSATASIVVRARVAPGIAPGTTLVNAVVVGATTPDPDPTNNTDTTSTPVFNPTDADLVVEKTDASDPSIAGTSVSYTLTVTNRGPATATGVTMTDTLPPGTSFVSGSPGCTANGSVVECAVGTLAPGSSAAAGITIATPPTPGAITNSVRATGNEPDPHQPSNTATQTTTLVTRADVSVLKGGPASVTAGTTIAYTINVWNAGPSVADAVVVSDPTPAGLTFVSTSGACATAFPCALGAMAPGTTRTIIATFAVPSSYTGPSPIVNTTTVTTTTTELDLTNNTSTWNTPLVIDSDVQITKSGPASIVPGQLLAYTLVVTNIGPSDALNVTVTDPTPTGVSFVSNARDCITTFPCALGTITAGGSRTIVATYRVPADGSTPSPILNTATVTSTTPDGNPANNVGRTSTLQAPPRADLVVEKAGPPFAQPGAPIQWSIEVRNDGPSVATGVSLADPTPVGLTFVSVSGACAGVFPCDLGAIAPGEHRSVIATFAVPPGYREPVQIQNTAIVSATTLDPNPTNNASTAQSLIGNDIEVTKIVDDPTPLVGGLVTFTVTARNLGPSDATGVEITDQLPVGLEFVSATPSRGAFDANTGIWTVGAIARLEAPTLALVTRVLTPGRLVNTASRTRGDQVDLNLSNNAGSAAVTGDPVADVRVRKMVDRALPNVGETVRYTMLVSNAGPNRATGVVFNDVFPAGLSILSYATNQGSYDPATGRWTIGTVDTIAPEWPMLEVVARVTAALPVVNIIRKSAQNEFDPNHANDASGAIVAGRSADLQVIKTVDRSRPRLGEVVTYTIAVVNHGPYAPDDVVVQDLLPEGLAFVSASATQGYYAPSSGLWQVGSLAEAGPDATARLTIQASVLATTATANTATVVGASLPDTNPLNNRDSVTISVDITPIDLAVLLNRTGDGCVAGEQVDFFVSVTNVGRADTSGPTVVTLELPDGLEYRWASDEWQCAPIGRSVVCRRDDLRLAEHVTNTVRIVTSADGRVSPAQWAHTSVMHGDDGNSVNNVDRLPICGAPVVTIPVDPSDLTTSLRGPAGDIRVGDTITITATVTNGGPDPSPSTTLAALVPGLAELVSVVPSSGVCTGTSSVTCTLGQMAPAESIAIAWRLRLMQPGVVDFNVAALGTEFDPDVSNNAATKELVVRGLTTGTLDSDGDGMPDEYEATVGLDALVNDAALDSDGDGVSNLDEYRAGTHPRGAHARYFAEGASSPFFTTKFDIANASETAAASVVVRLQLEDGTSRSAARVVPRLGRMTIDAATLVGSATAAFASVIESDVPVVADRTVSWDSRGYGAHAETSIAAPATQWYLAEGATHSGLNLFYLLQNPDSREAIVDVRFLRPPPAATMTRQYRVAPHSRLTIWVNQVAGLEATDVSADLRSANGVPIVVERAMYLDAPGEPFSAGHAAAGVVQPATSWILAEGATGAVFDEFILIANPGDAAAAVEVRYLLPDGTTLTTAHTVAARSRHTVWVDHEAAELASTSVSAVVTSVNGEPVVVERAMWWPGPTAADWYEAHVSSGATVAGERWAVAGGDAGNAATTTTYLLVANMASTAGSVRVRVLLDDGGLLERVYPLRADARFTIDIGAEFPAAAGKRFSAVVESVGAAPVPIVVERSAYGDAMGRPWASGTNSPATRLQ